MTNEVGGVAPRLSPQLSRFLVVGVSNLVLSYGVFAGALHLLGDFALRGTVAQMAAYCVGTVWSYYWNRRWTFRSDSPVGGEATRFIVLQIGCAILSTGLVGLAVDALRLHASLSWLVIVAFIAVINYALSKYWVFNRPSP